MVNFIRLFLGVAVKYLTQIFKKQTLVEDSACFCGESLTPGTLDHFLPLIGRRTDNNKQWRSFDELGNLFRREYLCK